MKKVLVIQYHEEPYYENSITVFTEKEGYKGQSYCNELILETPQEYYEAFREMVIKEQSNFEYIGIEEIYGLEMVTKAMSQEQFNYILENYELLDDMLNIASQQGAYDLFNREVYGESSDYGEFKQNLCLFQNTTMLCMKPEYFKETFFNQLSSRLSVILNADKKDARRIELAKQKNDLISMKMSKHKEIDRINERIYRIEEEEKSLS